MTEAQVLSRYLLGIAPDATAMRLYEQACEQLRDHPRGRDARIVAFACRYPWSLGALDAALALAKGDSLLRKKLYLMAAILETRPALADRFLPVDRSAAYILCIAYFGMRAIARAIAGMVLLPFIP